MTAVRVGPVDQPDLSVVMVTHNAWEWTERAVRALLDNTPPCFELIAVDNASTDVTVAGLHAVAGVTVVENPSNTGFGVACNQGALLGRGRYLLFLNSDALVHPGWLPPLLEVLDSEPDVDAVAPRLLNLDGSLQEAGSIVFHDGRVLNYGDGDDPGRPQYRFRRDVDYASAACLLIRRRAFHSLGGFDPAYAPAYFEDVDLCFALAAAGGRIVYQPRSTVTHVRWASGTQQATQALVERNQPRFASRWWEPLAHRTTLPEDRDPVRMTGARDLLAVERLLLLTDDSVAVQEHHLVRFAETVVRTWPRGRVTLATRGHVGPDAEESLRAAGVEVVAEVDAPDAWLEQRRHHYGAVLLAGDGSPAGWWAAVERSQPQASVLGPVALDRVRPHTAEPMAVQTAVEEILAPAGFAAPEPGPLTRTAP
jgi:GT2 family glycosyltransferase